MTKKEEETIVSLPCSFFSPVETVSYFMMTKGRKGSTVISVHYWTSSSFSVRRRIIREGKNVVMVYRNKCIIIRRSKAFSSDQFVPSISCLVNGRKTCIYQFLTSLRNIQLFSFSSFHSFTTNHFLPIMSPSSSPLSLIPSIFQLIRLK